MKKSEKCNKMRGFSLIEVTIAMAIAAVALVTLMGLIPQGMDTMKEAGDQAIMGRIHQQILNELQVAAFDKLDSYQNMQVFYDSQGEELGDSEGGGGGPAVKGSFEHIYSARISIPQAIGGSMPKSVGGASFGGMTFDKGDSKNLYIRNVVIEVAAVEGLGATFDWDETEVRKKIHTYQTNVVKMGQDFTGSKP